MGAIPAARWPAPAKGEFGDAPKLFSESLFQKPGFQRKIPAKWPKTGLLEQTLKQSKRHRLPRASGHWMAQEKPMEVNAARARWLAVKFPQLWPK
jgi:hypothetical protein